MTTRSRSRTKQREAPESITIGALSRATRIPAETLRTWERRYGSPMPVRRPTGHRVYSAATVEHLQRVARLISAGHRPGEILGLGVRELDRLLEVSGVARLESAALPPAEQPVALPAGGSITHSLAAAERFDRDRLMAEFRTQWARLGPLRFLQGQAAPLMEAIGSSWSSDSLGIRHEHFASGCLFDFLREVREPFDDIARGPRVLAATFSDDRHEGGLLMFSVLCAYRGHRVLWLGPDTPVAEIVDAARTGGVDIVAISVSSALPHKRAKEETGRLRRALPRRTELWLGGAGAPAAITGVVRFDSLDALDARLTA